MTLAAIAAIGMLEIFSFLRGGPRKFMAPSSGSANVHEPHFYFWGRHDARLVCLRRMADIRFLGGEVRDPRKLFPEACSGSAWRNRRLHVGKFCLRTRSRTCRTGSHNDARILGDAHVTRPARRLFDRRRNCVFLIWIPRPIDVDSSTRLFRDGRGPHLFSGVAWIDPRTHVPVVAILLQGVWAIVIALTGTYAQVVNYVVAMDSLFLA